MSLSLSRHYVRPVAKGSLGASPQKFKGVALCPYEKNSLELIAFFSLFLYFYISKRLNFYRYVYEFFKLRLEIGWGSFFFSAYRSMMNLHFTRNKGVLRLSRAYELRNISGGQSPCFFPHEHFFHSIFSRDTSTPISIPRYLHNSAQFHDHSS